MTKSLVLYSTIVGGFYAKTNELDKAVSTARTRVGNDVWKRGYSASDANGATAAANSELKEAGIKPVQVEGEIVSVGFVENHDTSGNAYPKLQVGLKKDDDQMLLSLDLKSDVAQKLVVKLDNCKPGDYVNISAWPTTVDRSGRQFVNHAASVKGSDGKEVPVSANFSAEVKKQTDGIEAALKAAGVDDNKVISTAKTTKRIAAHKDLLLKIQERFSDK